MTISTRQSGSSVRRDVATFTPSAPGICRSRTATSGRWARAIASASGPVAASATIIRSSSRESSAARAPRMRCSSSASSTRTVMK
ncbi:hypothetical protein ASE41_14305 [Streptomyces sp. Root264]|nr:hypothetical protein ASE41_14305 [Streptomyces sp. Root264]